MSVYQDPEAQLLPLSVVPIAAAGGTAAGAPAPPQAPPAREASWWDPGSWVTQAEGWLVEVSGVVFVYVILAVLFILGAAGLILGGGVSTDTVGDLAAVPGKRREAAIAARNKRHAERNKRHEADRKAEAAEGS